MGLIWEGLVSITIHIFLCLHTFRDLPSSLRSDSTGKTWIVKPISLNRGNGIEVFNNIADIVAYITSKSKGTKLMRNSILIHRCCLQISQWLDGFP